MPPPLRLALLALLALPVAAQEQGPNRDPVGVAVQGAVARVVLSRDLYALGMARGDAQLVLAAARLAAGVTLADVERIAETEPHGGGVPAEAMPPLPDAARMLADAGVLAGEDELVGGLIVDAGAEAARAAPSVASRSAGAVAPGARDTWRVAFFAGVTGEVAVLGSGTAALDTQVTDETGAVVCGSAGASDRLYCAFVPAWNGYFTVTVANPGTDAQPYDLLTN